MKILIIEDDPDTAMMLRLLLETQHEVLVSYNGNDAIKTGLQFKPELIISDWNLKGEIDGVAACKQIAEGINPIIIFVSGSPLEQLREVAEGLSPLHIFSKPLDFDHFFRVVEKIGGDGNKSQ